MLLLSSVSIWKINFKIWESDHNIIEGAAERIWKEISHNQIIKNKFTLAFKKAHCTMNHCFTSISV